MEKDILKQIIGITYLEKEKEVNALTELLGISKTKACQLSGFTKEEITIINKINTEQEPQKQEEIIKVMFKHNNGVNNHVK